MAKIQEELIKAEQDEIDESDSGANSKYDVAKLEQRRNLSKSTNLVPDKNQPKLLDDSSKGLGYNSF
jgi:hypothetical protein